MKLIEQLVGHFGLECIQDSIDENNSQFVSHYSVADPKLPQAARLKKSLALFPSRDTIILEWALEGFDGAILSNRSDESLDLFILTIETQLSLDDQPHNCHLSLRVEKSREAGALSVYSLPKLADFWARDGLPNAFRRFSDLRQSRWHYGFGDFRCQSALNVLFLSHSRRRMISNLKIRTSKLGGIRGRRNSKRETE